ncbi:phage tail protein [Methylohalobius crimeensis]|uniref:phage tail protein n=1 Tax=Methylohalobius crimeensis TaxID=244365 RepID=UPI0003B36D4C|nr:tail fiber protein [Methylohalobius crimeensis]
MAEPFIGEIRMFGFGWTPRDWARCDGALLEIQQNSALYALLGNRYGGNGTTNFALPDMRGRAPVHPGQDIGDAQAGGYESVPLTLDQIPAHNHPVLAASENGTTDDPGGAFPANYVDRNGNARDAFAPSAANPASLEPGTVSTTGGSEAHPNMQPYMGLNFCIALKGLWPSRS